MTSTARKSRQTGKYQALIGIAEEGRLRVGSAVMTIRGCGERESKIVDQLADDIFDAPAGIGVIAAVADKVQSPYGAFPFTPTRVSAGREAMQHSIVFLDRETLGARLRTPSFPHTYREYAATRGSEVVERLKDATIAIVNKVPMPRETLAQLPKLRLIAVAATGTDIIDKDHCRTAGIAVVNIRNYAYNTVPEHVFALIFALRRSLIAYREDVRQGVWQRVDQFCFFPHPIRDIAGSTLGIVGFGEIGKSVARRAEAFGMRVLATDIALQPGLVDLITLLKGSDIVTLHVPLTAQTRGMIGAEQLAMMQSSSILINTARGGLVDEQALATALRGGVIAGAGFDVLTSEPPKEGNVLLDLDLPNFILTPHIAWASQEAMQILADQLIDNIEAFMAGRPQNVVSEQDI